MKATIIKALSVGFMFACAGIVTHIWANQWMLGVKVLCSAFVGVIIWGVCYFVDSRIRS